MRSPESFWQDIGFWLETGHLFFLQERHLHHVVLAHARLLPNWSSIAKILTSSANFAELCKLLQWGRVSFSEEFWLTLFLAETIRKFLRCTQTKMSCVWDADPTGSQGGWDIICTISHAQRPQLGFSGPEFPKCTFFCPECPELVFKFLCVSTFVWEVHFPIWGNRPRISPKVSKGSYPKHAENHCSRNSCLKWDWFCEV